MKRRFKIAGLFAAVVATLGISVSVSAAGESKDSFTVAIATNPQGLDCTNNKMQDDFNVMEALYDTLIYPADENGEYAPRLATSWEWSSDTTMEFELRDDVYFSNGEKMTAEDVAFSIANSCVSPSNKSFFTAFDAENTKAIDENTVQIGFQFPFAEALTYLSSTRGGIVCKSLYEEVGADAYAQNPVGTGMFVLEDWTQGASLTLKRNDDYWNTEKIPAYSTLVFRIIGEASVRAAELEAGGIDASFSIANVDFDRLSFNDQLVCFEEPGYNHTCLQMNAAKEELQDIRVREALCISLDIPAIVNAVYGTHADVATGMCSSSIRDYSDQGGYTYDPERAKELLAEAGYADGFDVEVTIWPDENIESYVTIAKEQWAQVGINATINILEQVTVVERNNAGENQLSCSFTTAHSGTAGDALKNWGSNWIGALHMKDEYIDDMLQKGLSEMDSEKRAEIYAELQEYLWNTYYEIMFAYPHISFVYNKNVEGLEITSNCQIKDYSAITIAE